MNVIISCHIVFIILLCGFNFSQIFNENCIFGPAIRSNLLFITSHPWNIYHVCYYQLFIHKKFRKRRIIYTRNGTATFNPQILIFSDDIHPNPCRTSIPQTGHAINLKKNDAYSCPKLCSDLPSGFRITQWNLRSIAPRTNNTKLDEIKLILRYPGNETHILGVTESWLDETIDDSRIKITGYIHMKELTELRLHYQLIRAMPAELLYTSKRISYMSQSGYNSVRLIDWSTLFV